ncbi:hypothetical protein ALC60_03472 [Trachymyrmex zeteki]|uniref:Uncharacterized protein n=1 Tax=Mycetomoellerius zeteki TaxID=64791 RepID=A0A151XB34_9HYME|nr:hypothetical protein ALC60_03472 [Trachymyrmex zeteki]
MLLRRTYDTYVTGTPFVTAAISRPPCRPASGRRRRQRVALRRKERPSAVSASRDGVLYYRHWLCGARSPARKKEKERQRQTERQREREIGEGVEKRWWRRRRGERTREGASEREGEGKEEREKERDAGTRGATHTEERERQTDKGEKERLGALNEVRAFPVFVLEKKKRW